MKVLITGAAGNIGSKLRAHLEGRYILKLLDKQTSDSHIVEADLSRWNSTWAQLFTDVETVVHLAANPNDLLPWDDLVSTNMDATINTYLAALRASVKRFVYASSNHVMGGYKDLPEVKKLTTNLPPKPGTHYFLNGAMRDSTPYAAMKLFGERIGECHALSSAMSVVSVRIGWVQPGRNEAQDIPVQTDPWFKTMWLSNRDLCHLLERCILADLPFPSVIVNGMSANSPMVWDIEETERLIGYKAEDGLHL